MSENRIWYALAMRAMSRNKLIDALLCEDDIGAAIYRNEWRMWAERVHKTT
jgi:hypothetical protein